MSIPVATTTITVLRPGSGSQYDEPYEAPTSATTTIATGVRAVIDNPTARAQTAGGQQVVTTLRLTCDPCGLHYLDLVRDDRTGITYRVVWVVDMGGDGSDDHIEAGLENIEGLV